MHRKATRTRKNVILYTRLELLKWRCCSRPQQRLHSQGLDKSFTLTLDCGPLSFPFGYIVRVPVIQLQLTKSCMLKALRQG